MVVVTDGLVSTSDAAKAMNVHPTTLRRWADAGVVTAPGRTAGGHARWDVEKLREQVRAHLKSQD